MLKTMYLSLLVVLFAGICSCSEKKPFQLRSPTSSRLLGFNYDSKPFFGGECKGTFDKYLKATEDSKEGVRFKFIDCDHDGYCRLSIVDGDYQGYCLGGQPRPESQTCNTDNNIFKANLDFTIITRDGKYLGIGDEYYDDCTNYQYAKLGDEKYRWLFDYDKNSTSSSCMGDGEMHYQYFPRGSQRRIFG